MPSRPSCSCSSQTATVSGGELYEKYSSEHNCWASLLFSVRMLGKFYASVGHHASCKVVEQLLREYVPPPVLELLKPTGLFDVLLNLSLLGLVVTFLLEPNKEGQPQVVLTVKLSLRPTFSFCVRQPLTTSLPGFSCSAALRVTGYSPAV